MPLESRDFRDVIEPQDIMAIVITLLGLAIALFLDDSVIKLIGLSIAVLGAIAFYMTVRGRINDRIQLRKKRTTLPTPAFKTQVTTDPATNTRRVRFDDFQETFQVSDDEVDEEESSRPEVKYGKVKEGGEGTRTIRFDDAAISGGATDRPYEDSAASSHSVAEPTTPPRPSSTPDRDEPAPIEGEGFRVVKSSPSTERTSEPSDQERRSDKSGRTSEASSLAMKETRRKPSEEPQARSDDSAPSSTIGSSLERVDTLTTDQKDSPRRKPVRRQVQLVLDGLSEEQESETTENEPRAEFVRLVDQVLRAIARSMEARTILFCWVNLQKGHYIPEAAVCSDRSRVRIGERISIGNDLVSQIARGGVPEIVTDISITAESELVGYYGGRAGTHSFVGVPVFFRQEVVGVLAADSTTESGFDEGAVATLAEYTILISQMIRGYTEKFDLYLMRKGVQAYESLHSELARVEPSPNAFAKLLVEHVHEMIDPHYTAAVIFDPAVENWRVMAVASNADTVAEKLRQIQPDMLDSTVGAATRNAEEIYLPTVENQTLFASGEDFARGGSFLALPLMAASKCYGALVVSHTVPNALVPRDIDLLRDLGRYVAMAIEVVITNAALQEHLVFDEVTGFYNESWLLAQLEREIARARDFSVPVSFLLLSPEPPSSLSSSSEEVHEILPSEVGDLVAGRLRKYDLIGHTSDGGLGVILVGKNDQDAWLWAERLRKDVASKIVNLGSRTFSATISAGLCDLETDSTPDSVVAGARQALAKATSDGGNSVVIY